MIEGTVRKEDDRCAKIVIFLVTHKLVRVCVGDRFSMFSSFGCCYFSVEGKCNYEERPVLCNVLVALWLCGLEMRSKSNFRVVGSVAVEIVYRHGLHAWHLQTYFVVLNARL